MLKINRYVTGLALAALLLSCGKKEVIVIPKNGVKEFLIKYEQENPETHVLIETQFGNITLKLYEDTPLHRANFVKLIKDDYYATSNFYRIVPQFVIQAGDQMKKLDYMIPAEISPVHFHKKGALGMARFEDNNPGMESSAAEFYIVAGGKYPDWQIDDEAKSNGLQLTPEQRQTYLSVGGEMSLDGKYTIFGEVIEGLEVVDKIASSKVYGERPLRPVPLHISLIDSKE